jgi:arylsulfate sulfotransferase
MSLPTRKKTTGSFKVKPSFKAHLIGLTFCSLLLSACGGGGDETPAVTPDSPTPVNSNLTASIAASDQGDESGPINLLFTVTLSQINNGAAAIVFDLATQAESTATPNSDYTLESAQLAISVGSVSASVIVRVIDDSDIEALETLVLKVSSSDARITGITQETASASITDNDSPDNGAPSDGQGYNLSLSAHDNNALIVNATISTQADAKVQLEFSSPGLSTKLTPQSPLGKEHLFSLYGLRAQTQYQVTPIISLNSGEVMTGQSQSITTAAIPYDLPQVQLISHQGASAGGLTFLSATDPAQARFFAVDEAGEVVWYLDDDTINMSVSPTVKNLANGQLLLLLSREARIIDLTGATISSIPLPAYHHDVQLLPNGNLLALVTQTRTLDGKSLQGDEIIEVNPAGDIIWRWSTLDHLDTARFPGALSQRVLSNGALDWTHSNALAYLAHDDSIVLSSRSQSWVVNIDHASSEIIWIFGDSTGANAILQEKFFTLTSGSWQANQHAPMFTAVGDLLLYDNRNEATLSGASNNSRAVKYSLNTNLMQAAQTWEYVTPKYTQALGDVDELSNGNLLINAGGPGSSDDAHIIEVTAQTSTEVLWEIKLANTAVYRAERMSWDDFLMSSVRSIAAATPDPITDPKIDIAHCQEALHFVDTNNPDNYIDFDMDGRTNAEVYGAENTPSLAVSCDSDTLSVDTNGATNFDWVNLGQGGNAGPMANDYHWSLPRNPQLTNERVAIPLLGPVAITVTGIQIFGPNENGADNYADPVTDGLLNYCGGHTRDYHFHERAKCFFEYPTLGGADSLLPAQTAGVVLGYALDGFPIMSPWECTEQSCTQVEKVSSSYRYTGTGDYSNENAWESHVYEAALSPLDECNGMTRPDGSYAYYATETWPYYLACYRGPTHLVGENNPRG